MTFKALPTSGDSCTTQTLPGLKVQFPMLLSRWSEGFVRSVHPKELLGSTMFKIEQLKCEDVLFFFVLYK